MGKPVSSLTTAVTIRLPNDLLESVGTYAEAQGFINQSGRLDKRGQPNLSAAVSALLRQALEVEHMPTSTPEKLSDSVIPLLSDQDRGMTTLEHRLIDRVRETVTQQLQAFFNHGAGTTLNTSNDGPALAVISEGDSTCEQTSTQTAQDTKEDTRDRILHAASRGFRSHGYNGIGVNTLAKDAGVTSGAFYGYFRSKEDAFLAAVVEGLDEYRAGIEAFRAQYGVNWSVALADYYVGRQHRENLACGCALPTLSPEVIRSDRRVRTAYQIELMKLNDAIAAGLTSGTATEKRETAWVMLSVLAGGLTLARAVWDESLAEQIAGAVHHATVAIASGSLENTRQESS